MLLSDVAAAKAKAKAASLLPTSTDDQPPVIEDVSPSSKPESSPSPPSSPDTYPFNLLLTSATIPTTLHNYLSEHHPNIQRLVSPGVHKLPKDLKVEYESWTGGNRMADVEKRIRQVWAEDSLSSPTQAGSKLSQVLVFCNKTNKVRLMGQYLEAKGIKNVAVTSTSETRARGSNRHLDGFLRVLPGKETDARKTRKKAIVWDNELGDGLGDSGLVHSSSASPSTVASHSAPSTPQTHPHVLITTSLLSRGLDFAPSIRHVFIVDEPRNVLDFLHRAGRSGRAGHKGKVVVFGKFPQSGRGAGRGREVKQKVGELLSRRRRKSGGRGDRI